MPGDPPSEGCWDWTGSKATRGGYGTLTITEEGSSRTLPVHRLAYELFHGPIPDGMWVLHDCDRPVCCHPDHLHLGTQRENMREARERNRLASGDRHPFGKLTDEQVRWVREQTNMLQKDIAAALGVSQPLISMIRSGVHRGTSA